MAVNTDADVEEKLLHVKAPPPAMYYTKYTNENVKNGTIPSPPSVPIGNFTAFGISHNVSI